MAAGFVTIDDNNELPEAVKGPLDGAYVGRRKTGFQPPILQRVTSESTGTGPRFIDQFDGLLWGVVGATGDIYNSLDGTTWTLYCNSFTGGADANGWISRLIPTADGEMIALNAHGLFKSSGWAGGNTATWSASKVTSNGTGIFNPFALDGDGQKFILAEYSPTPASWGDSRYAYISTDAGGTWTRVYDSEALHGAAASAESHLHGACYDPWSDRFYLSEGHGEAGGIYTSTDDGATWSATPMNVESDAMTGTNGPTLIMATDDGLVMGSDNPENGLFGVLRKDNPADEKIVRTWELHTGRNGLITFAQRGWRDPDTGLVYVTFRSEYPDTPVSLAAGTPSSGGLVWEHPQMPVSAASRFAAVAKTDSDTLFFYGEIDGTATHFQGTLTRPGAHPDTLLDTGNTRGGKTADSTGLALGRAIAAANQALAAGQGANVQHTAGTAVGYQATTTSNEATAIGNLSTAGNAATAVGSHADGGTSGVSIGYNAAVSGTLSVTIGNSAAATGSSVAIGQGSEVGGSGSSVAIGQASSTTTESVAVGQGAHAFTGGVAVGARANLLGNYAIAIGMDSISNLDGIAIGQGADASLASRSVAIGKDATVTANDQVNFGARHFELGQVTTEPGAPAAGLGRFYFRDNGAGKSEFVVQFPSGAAQVVVTEP